MLSNDKKRKLNAVEELMLEQERAKEKHGRKEYWITPGIVVKVLNKALNSGKYYKQKGMCLLSTLPIFHLPYHGLVLIIVCRNY